MGKLIIYFYFIVSIVLLSGRPFSGLAQEVEKSILKDFTISGYIDAYYTWDSDKDMTLRQFPAFEPYRNRFGLNIAQVSMDYNTCNVRGKATIQYGDIPKVLYPEKQQYVQEANLGFSPFKNLWIDMGYFTTHIGAESLPINNFFSSYSMGSYLEPQYQSGIRVSYDFSEKLGGSLHLLNGYNIFDDDNKYKSFGMQVNYSATDKLSFTYNNIMGYESTEFDGISKFRFLNNFFTYYSPSEKLDFILGLDFAIQESSKISDSNANAYEYSATLSARYKFTPKLYLSLRGEFTNDEDGFLSGLYIDEMGKISGLKIFGITGALEYRPAENYYVRLESRFLSADRGLKIFYGNSNTRTEVTLNSGIEF